MDELISQPETPIFLGEEGQEVFGWIHRAGSKGFGGTGVVICSSFGREELCAHRTSLHLAQAAVGAGMPAIRFDYHGTGDSAGGDSDPDRVSSWVASVRLAIEGLKAQTGVTQVCLVGIRLGVTLAAVAAEGRDDVVAMVAIAPVVSGKAFTRELRMLAGTSSGPAANTSPAAYIESGGFMLTAQTQADISAIDLTKRAQHPGLRCLILDRDEAPTARAWMEQLISAGGGVSYERFAGYPAMMEGTNYNVIPYEMISTVKRWLGSIAASDPSVRGGADAERRAAKDVLPVARPRFLVHEAAVVVDADVSLYGIASIGDAPAPSVGSPGAEGVILLSAGIARRIGPSRLYVDLARRWAAAGHTVLRLDLSGIGDSPAHPGHPEQTVYASSAEAEVVNAVRYLFARGGVTRCHVVGMCSGSYHGFKAALAGANVSSLTMINPLTFHWDPEDVLTSVYAEHEVAFAAESYSRLWKEPEKWVRIIRGDFDFRQVSRTIAQRLWMGIRSVGFDVARLINIRVAGHLGTQLESLASRGIKLRFIFSTNEPGPALLASKAGSSLGRLQRKGMLTQTTIPASDHIFTTHDARVRLADLLTESLFGTPSSPPVKQVATEPVALAMGPRTQ